MEKCFVRIGIFGIGSTHTQFIGKGVVPGFELTAVADLETSRFRRCRCISDYDDGSALIRSEIVDAILVATPHYTNTKLGIVSTIHTLVNNSISIQKEDCQCFIQASTGPKQVFAAMSNQCMIPAYSKLHDLIRTGELGEVHRMNRIFTNRYCKKFYYRTDDRRANWGCEGSGIALNQSPTI